MVRWAIQREAGNRKPVVVRHNVCTQIWRETFRKIALQKPEKEVTFYVAWFVGCLMALPNAKIIILSNDIVINKKMGRRDLG
jgi:hypothetical protein